MNPNSILTSPFDSNFDSGSPNVYWICAWHTILRSLSDDEENLNSLKYITYFPHSASFQFEPIPGTYVAAYFHLTVRYKCCQVESRSAVVAAGWQLEDGDCSYRGCTWYLTTVLQF